MSEWKRTKAQKEIEKEILKEIETPMEEMDMELEVVEARSTENMMRMEEAANIAATAFGDDHVSARTMRQEITKKRMEKKLPYFNLSKSQLQPLLFPQFFQSQHLKVLLHFHVNSLT